MTSYRTLLSGAVKLAQSLLSRRTLPIFGLFLIGALISINLEDAAVGLDPRQENLKITLNLMLGLWDMAEGLLLLLILSWAIPVVHPLRGTAFLAKPFDRPYLSSFFAEYLRMLGHILMWGLLLIVPGFVRYVQLIFVIPIVLFSADYENDKVDALKLSRELVHRHLKFLIPVLLLTTVAQFALELAPHMYAELHILPARLMLNFASYLISIWSYSLMVLLFEREMQK